MADRIAEYGTQRARREVCVECREGGSDRAVRDRVEVGFVERHDRGNLQFSTQNDTRA